MIPPNKTDRAAREWIIKGGLYVYDRPGGSPGNQCINHVDGELLGFNESVRVREVLPDQITITREDLIAKIDFMLEALSKPDSTEP